MSKVTAMDGEGNILVGNHHNYPEIHTRGRPISHISGYMQCMGNGELEFAHPTGIIVGVVGSFM